MERRANRTRRWWFACGSRFYTTHLWHCDFFVMREYALVNKSIFLPALWHISLFSYILLLTQPQFSFIIFTSCNLDTFIFCFILSFLLFYGVLLYCLESELVFLQLCFLRESTISFSFLFLYLYVSSHIRLLSFTFQDLLFLSVSSFLFDATVSFVPAVLFMQILMATTTEATSYS